VIASRRQLLAGASALVLAGCARGTPDQAPPAETPAAFLNLARAATGGVAVDAALAGRIYADLRAHHAGFDARMPQLTAALRALDGDGARLAQDPQLGAIFTDLIGGLYLGVTGPQPARRCLGFESIESYRLFDGVLAPPSYAGGAPGSWAAPVGAVS
jgi:outer membrane protein TolC